MMRLVLLGGRAARLTGAPGRSGHLNGWRPRALHFQDPVAVQNAVPARCALAMSRCFLNSADIVTIKIDFHHSYGVRVYLGRTTVYDGSNWECYFYHELMKSQDAGKENWRDQ
ncbi:uncharacterized protein LOC103790112 isoform X4 [Callithrix jacchus]